MRPATLRAFRLLAGSLIVGSSAACLPTESRDPPGTLVVSASGDATARGIIVSDDGWSITLSRWLVALGDIKLEGDDCDSYSDNDYSRILDLLRPERQRVSTVFGLGACQMQFQIASPSWSAVPGAGVSADEIARFRSPAEDPSEPQLSATVYLEGAAVKAGEQKQFAWFLRRVFEYRDCGMPDAPSLLLTANTKAELEIVLDVVELFRPAADAPLSFEPFRTADEQGNADGKISLNELLETPFQETTLEDALLESLKRIARVTGSGACVGGPAQERHGL